MSTRTDNLGGSVTWLRVNVIAQCCLSETCHRTCDHKTDAINEYV